MRKGASSLRAVVGAGEQGHCVFAVAVRVEPVQLVADDPCRGGVASFQLCARVRDPAVHRLGAPTLAGQGGSVRALTLFAAKAQEKAQAPQSAKADNSRPVRATIPACG